jgi:hypothetical protein
VEKRKILHCRKSNLRVNGKRWTKVEDAQPLKGAYVGNRLVGRMELSRDAEGKWNCGGGAAISFLKGGKFELEKSEKLHGVTGQEPQY